MELAINTGVLYSQNVEEESRQPNWKGEFNTSVGKFYASGWDKINDDGAIGISLSLQEPKQPDGSYGAQYRGFVRLDREASQPSFFGAVTIGDIRFEVTVDWKENEWGGYLEASLRPAEKMKREKKDPLAKFKGYFKRGESTIDVPREDMTLHTRSGGGNYVREAGEPF